MEGAPADNNRGHYSQDPESGRVFAAGWFFVEGMNDAAFLGASHTAIDGLFDAGPDAAGNGTEESRPFEQLQNRGGDAIGGLDLLEFELVAPGDKGTPDQLVGGDDDEDYDRETGNEGAHIAGVGGGL